MENESDCRTVFQLLISSIPQRVLMRTSYKEKEHEIGTQSKTITVEEPDQKCRVNDHNPEQERLFGGVGC